MIRVVPTQTTGTVKITSAGSDSFVSTSSLNESNIVKSTTNEAYYYYNLALQSANSAGQSAQNAQNYYNLTKNLKFQSDWSENDSEETAFIKNKPTRLSDFQDDLGNSPIHAHSQYAQSSSLATVATTGNYSDLTGTPNLANVATTGDYGDLANKPVIPIAYGTSSTGASTAQKVVNIPAITALETGQIIVVQPSTTSSVANSTIKLNSFSAYPMRYNNSAITTTTDSIVWNSAFPSIFIFNGTYWVFLGHGIDSNSTYKAMTVSEGIGGITEDARLLRSTNLKQIIQGTTLTGLSTADSSNVAATDSITTGIGKLQAQLSGLTAETSRNIGEIVTSTIPLTDSGLHLLDGALISGSGSYSAFVDYIADLYDGGNYPDLFDTEANWQTAVTTYGVCGKFVYDSVNSTVRLPKIIGFTEGTIDPTVLGDLVQAGLPNITGEWSPASYRFGAPSSYDPAGALYKESSSGDRAGYGGSGNTISLKFDASRSNSIYGNSATVQPQAIKVLYYIVIATSTKTAIQVDIDEIATDLNGKADTDGSNMISSVKNFDGAWNVGFRTVIVEGATFASATVYTYDISSALPQDNYNYDVMVQFSGETGATSGNGMYVFIASDIGGSAPVDTTKMTQILRIRAVNSTSQYGAATVIYPVGTQRKLYFYSTAGASVSSVIINITGYRRIGTNS